MHYFDLQVAQYIISKVFEIKEKYLNIVRLLLVYKIHVVLTNI